MKLCKHYPLCGGCKTQEIPYSEQLQAKEKKVHDLFAPFCDELRPIIGSAPHLHYRGKMELSFSQTKEGEKFLGLRMSGKKGRVFLIEECHLCPSWMIDVAKHVYQWWSKSTIEAYFPPKDKGTLRTLTLRQGDENERMVILTVSGNELYPLPDSDIALFREALLKTSLSSIVLLTQVAKPKEPTYFIERILYGNDHFKATLGVVVCKVRPQAFFQPNRFTSLLLYEQAIAMGGYKKEDIVYDLYCGTGTLSLLLSPYVKKIIGIELNVDAVRDAQDNILSNQVANMEVYSLDVAKMASLPLEPATVLHVDPPRAGLGTKVIAILSQLKIKKIVYISCNPETQVVDIMGLVQAGYKLNTIQPIDQFPHTHHVENIALLTLS